MSSQHNILFRTKQNKKRTVIAPLVITYNPGNPKFKQWIISEIGVIHEDHTLKKIFPSIDVVTRQTANIKSHAQQVQE